jgi:hypothetical protein
MNEEIDPRAVAPTFATYFEARPFIRPRRWMLTLEFVIVFGAISQHPPLWVIGIWDWASSSIWLQNDVTDPQLQVFLRSTWYISIVAAMVVLVIVTIFSGECLGPVFLGHPLVLDVVLTTSEAVLFSSVTVAYASNIGRSSSDGSDWVSLIVLVLMLETGFVFIACVVRTGTAYHELRTWNRTRNQRAGAGDGSPMSLGDMEDVEEPLLQAYRDQEGSGELVLEPTVRVHPRLHHLRDSVLLVIIWPLACISLVDVLFAIFDVSLPKPRGICTWYV